MNNYWKCLDCGAGGELTIDNAMFMDSCDRCSSKHLELKMGGIHFVLLECDKCHKIKDVKYLDVSPGFNQQAATTEAKKVWKNYGVLCTCSKSILWWVLGIGAIVIIVASLIGYFWWKNSKKTEQEEN